MSSSSTYYLPLKHAVERLFNSWTGLQLAVEHGMGGQNGRKTAIEMIEYVTNYCCTVTNIDMGELKTVLDDIMDEEFETICEDNSTQELAHLLAKYTELCRLNMQDQMLLEVSQLPPCQLWLCKPQLQNSLPIQPHEIIHDEDDIDDSVENHADTSQEPMDEDVEPGWTVVKSKKR